MLLKLLPFAALSNLLTMKTILPIMSEKDRFKLSYSVATMTVYRVFFIFLVAMKVADFRQKFDKTY